MKNSLIYSSIALIVITMETFTFFAPHIIFTCQNLESMLHCGSVTVHQQSGYIFGMVRS